MPVRQIDLNEPVELAAFFSQIDGQAVNPTTIVLLITKPDGSTITKAKADMSNPATGDFRYTVTADQAGVWSHRWTPSNGAIQEEFFLVGKPSDDGPCDSWIGPQDVFACVALSDIAEAARDYSLASECADAATRILYSMSGRRYPGICRATIRPCLRAWGLCSCGAALPTACSCSGGTISELRLSRDFPVLGVQEVLVDGAAVASNLYRVDDDHWLVRLDGTPWPSVQDLSVASSESNTWAVTFFYGRPVPADGVLAAKALACELYRGYATQECELPHRVRSKVLQGVEVSFIEPADFEDGQVGVREADLFLQAVRVGDAQQPTSVFNPDMVGDYRRVGT